MESPQASAGTVTPRFQAASTSVGVAGYRRTCCYFRCYFRPGRGAGYEKTAISRGFLKWCRRRDSPPPDFKWPKTALLLGLWPDARPRATDVTVIRVEEAPATTAATRLDCMEIGGCGLRLPAWCELSGRGMEIPRGRGFDPPSKRVHKRIPPAVQRLADDRGPHEVVIRRDQHPKGCGVQ